MEVYNYVADDVSNGGVRVVIRVVEDPKGFIIGSFGGLRLLGREGTKVEEHSGINGDGLIEECADYMLHKVDGLWGQ